MSNTQACHDHLFYNHWETRPAFKMIERVRADSHALGVVGVATTITGTACSSSNKV